MRERCSSGEGASEGIASTASVWSAMPVSFAPLGVRVMIARTASIGTASSIMSVRRKLINLSRCTQGGILEKTLHSVPSQ